MFAICDTCFTEELEQEMKRVFSIEEEVRLRNRCMNDTYKHLNKMDSTLQNAGLFQRQVSIQEKEFCFWNTLPDRK